MTTRPTLAESFQRLDNTIAALARTAQDQQQLMQQFKEDAQRDEQEWGQHGAEPQASRSIRSVAASRSVSPSKQTAQPPATSNQQQGAQQAIAPKENVATQLAHLKNEVAMLEQKLALESQAAKEREEALKLELQAAEEREDALKLELQGIRNHLQSKLRTEDESQEREEALMAAAATLDIENNDSGDEE